MSYQDQCMEQVEKAEDLIHQLKRKIMRAKLKIERLYEECAENETEKMYYMTRIEMYNDFIKEEQQNIINIETSKFKFERLVNAVADWEAIKKETQLLEALKIKMAGVETQAVRNDTIHDHVGNRPLNEGIVGREEEFDLELRVRGLGSVSAIEQDLDKKYLPII